MRAAKPAPDYAAIARFRTALRAFESATEDAARAADLTLQRYLLLLMVKGAPNGEERATVNELAARLRLEPHTVTGLVTRTGAAGLVTRERCTEDRRRTWIRLTPAGERKLTQVVAQLDARRDELLGALERAAGSARSVAGAARSGD